MYALLHIQVRGQWGSVLSPLLLIQPVRVYLNEWVEKKIN